MYGRQWIGKFSSLAECVDLALRVLNYALDESSEIVVQPEARVGYAGNRCFFRQFWRDSVKPWQCSAGLQKHAGDKR